MDLWFALFVGVVALAAAVGFSLTLVTYVNSLIVSFSRGWQWALITVGLPIVGGLALCYRFREDYRKMGLQLLAGALSLLLAAGLVYGGPGAWFAKRPALQLQADQPELMAPAAPEAGNSASSAAPAVPAKP